MDTLYRLTTSKEATGIPKVSSKRPITLPVDPCQQVGIEPEDQYQGFVVDGRIIMIKKVHGAAKGILKPVEGDASMTDAASLPSALD